MLKLAIGLLFAVNVEAGIILIGDTGKDNPGQRKVSESIQALCKKEECALGILAGDNVYPGGVKSSSDRILERVFDKYYNPLKIPFLVAMGNHDYGRLGFKWWRGTYQLLHAKKNPSFHLPHYWYVHETAETVFAIIDTARMMWRKDLLAQTLMVIEAEKKAKASGKWFIVIGHHPYLSNGREGNAGQFNRIPFPYFMSGIHVKNFLESNVCGKAHFYLSGHDHSLQVIDGNIIGCNTTLVVSGSGASTSVLFKRNLPMFESLKRGYFHLSINSQALKLRAFDENTKVLYERVFARNH